MTALLDAVKDESEAPARTSSDSRLVRACLRGDDRAWSALIAKYERLIFSVLIRRGASRDDAADIFQAVGSIGFVRGRCLERLARSLRRAGFE